MAQNGGPHGCQLGTGQALLLLQTDHGDERAPHCQDPRHRFGDEVALIDEVVLIVDCHDYRQKNTAGLSRRGERHEPPKGRMDILFTAASVASMLVVEAQTPADASGVG
jgi:hypothetical protein